MIQITEKPNSVVLKVRVQPGASTAVIVGDYNGALKIKVSAPPEKGKANRAVIAFLAKKLDLRKNSFTILSGTFSRDKILEINGLGKEELLKKLHL